MAFDWKTPNYQEIFQERIENLKRIRARPELVPALKLHYKHNPIDFIEDWGVTYDPRLIERGQSPIVPMILFPRQREFINWVLERWRASESGLSDKSRDMGLSVVCQQLSATLCLFHNNLAIGFGSRKEDLVDKVGDPDTLFYKGRMFLEHLPEEFRGGFDVRNKDHSSHLKIWIPETQSIMKGEAGDNIGRGGRTSLYFDDESAFQPRPQLIDAALSATTNCRISVSSVNGSNNPFAKKRFSWPAHRIFTFHWRSDPRKNDEWYAKKCADIDNPVIVAQEIDLNYNASKDGILIPSEWVQAAIDAHKVLGITDVGRDRAGYDVADGGVDLCAYAHIKGVIAKRIEAWSGKGSDTLASTNKVFLFADQDAHDEVLYDADGLGAGVKGDARAINENRASKIKVVEFRGSGGVIDPDAEIIKGEGGRKGRTNKEFFKNRKAQEWWRLAGMFKAVYRAVVDKLPYNPDDIICLDAEAIGIENLQKLAQELSQVTWGQTANGLIIIDKAPDGQRSPNLADALMIAASKSKRRSGF